MHLSCISVVSSAYIIWVNIFVADTLSFMYMMKSNGPTIEPCGTPGVIFDIPDLLSSKSIYCFLFVKI